MGTIAVDAGQVRDMLNENKRLSEQVTELQKANNREVERKRDWKFKYGAIKAELHKAINRIPNEFNLSKMEISRIHDLEPERPT